MHLRKALALSAAAARDWEAILKIDPSNQIAWNNLASSRLSSSYFLYRMGRLDENRQQLRAVLAQEKQMAPSAMLGSTLSLGAGALTALEAEMGNRQAAEAALADYGRLVEIATRDLAKDSYMRASIREVGYFGIGMVARYAIPAAAADYATVHNLAQSSLEHINALKPKDPLQELIKNRGLGFTYWTLADASYNLKDYAAADKEIKLAIDYGQRVPQRTLQDERDLYDLQILAAMIAAREGRRADAQRIIDPALKFHRGLYARNSEDMLQHLQLARALYASALAGSGQASSQLTEAAAIIDRMPPEMNRSISVARLRGWIAEEQKARR